MISVIIPTHNRSDLLVRAIDSALNQTYDNIEIIVVSDGSTDNTEEVVSKYEDSRIRFIGYEDAKGANFARNLGIKSAEGEYVAFLDDDDEWTEDKLNKQLVEFLKKDKVGLVYTGIEHIYVDYDTTYTSTPYLSGNLSKDILFRNYIGSTSSAMAKTELVRKVGMFDVKMPAKQDYDLWIRICQESEIGFVKDICVKYYNYNSSGQISGKTDKYEKATEIIREKYAHLFSKLSEQEIRKITSDDNLFLATNSLRNNNGKKARNFARLAYKNKPNLKSVIIYFGSFINYASLLKIRKIFKK